MPIQQPGTNGLPTIIRGVVDLAFEEAGSWVLVDFKSDDTPERDLDHLTAHYTPQLLAYAAAWSSQIPVKETRPIFHYFGMTLMTAVVIATCVYCTQ